MASMTETANEPRLMNDMDAALERANTLLTLVRDVQDRLETVPQPGIQGQPSNTSPTPNNLTSKLETLNNTLSLAIEEVRGSKALLG